MDVKHYLVRLRYDGPTAVSVETLRALHRAHLFAVPFENLSIHANERVQLDVPWLFDKIVVRNRGGFCYELNGLFAALLRELGFQTERLAARVFGSDGQPGIEFDHMTLRVDLDEPWLADVGFGDCFLEPIRLQPGLVQPDRTHDFRLSQTGNGLQLETRRANEPWCPLYLFDLVPRALSDFEPGCIYHQTSPDSSFTKRRVCSHPTTDGRFSLSERRQIITRRDGSKAETLLPDERAYTSVLRDEFGIVLAAPWIQDD